MKEAIVHLFGDKQINELSYPYPNGQYWGNLDYNGRQPADHIKVITAYAIG
jgi:hypothetical protein